MPGHTDATEDAAQRAFAAAGARWTRKSVHYNPVMAEFGTMRVKSGLAEMLKGGVIMDVDDAEQARIAEDAGAVAVMALERVPADIRAQGGVARMADPTKIREIQEAVTIPVMAKAASATSSRRRSSRRSRSTTSTSREVLTPADERAPRRQVGLHRPVRLRLRRTSARRCAASPRARR